MAINNDKREVLDVYLSLGTNMGNRKENLEAAVAELECYLGKLVSISSIYKTEGWGSENLDWFYNQVVKFKSDHTALDVLEICLKVENKLGRMRNNDAEYQNRLIDIDVLFIGDLIINENQLVLPHPYLHLRNFVLHPLVELGADIQHPIIKKSVGELKEMCLDGNLIIKIE